VCFAVAIVLLAGVGFLRAAAKFLTGGFAFVDAIFFDGCGSAGFFAAALTAACLAGFGFVAAAGLGGWEAVCAKAGGTAAVNSNTAIARPSSPRQVPRAIQVSGRRGIAPAVSWPDQRRKNTDHSMPLQ
jgi:hypothetical protein